MLTTARLLVGVPLLIAASALAPGSDQDQDKLYREGKKAFRGCAPCHCVNEPKIREDEDWLQLNKVTKCINAGDKTPRVRKALDTFLRSPKTLRPLLVNENFRPTEDMFCGKVKVPATPGSAYLKADRDSISFGTPAKVRLYWGPSKSGQTLTVPAGNYRVINYRFYRHHGKSKERWTLSVCDMNGCGDLSVAADDTVALGLSPAARAAVEAEREGQTLDISLALRNTGDNRLTLSRDGGFVLPLCSIVTAEGKELHRAEFENT